ncbi:DUF3572 domain-containing protein [Altererythrobacter sp. H2]|uniref:DUF3572 domain-containing protein n=1 Tax=Altererythrobacter sp. H2 TaxID=3108391 RepID=UPI000BC4DA5F|nr:DUF3572 domain-containing protein [Altererythrobacter sp. H2]OZA92475.1 MAG: hypothetical protein B7X57_08140 [Erythrobacter sp. 34-65-8]WRK96350.1 DUF3572 domain-containing protein [Altererythrobacter sp. H2]
MKTIPDSGQSPGHHSGDPETLALSALGWVLTDEDRSARLLALTGLDSETLRDHLTEQTTLAAVLEFLINHEPDLLLAADALGRTPQELVEAHRRLAA